VTLEVRALAVLADGPTRASSVATRLECTAQAALDTLTRLHRRGAARRLGRGVYALPGDTRPAPAARWSAAPERPGMPTITPMDRCHVDAGAEAYDVAAGLAGMAGSGIRVAFGGTDESPRVTCAAGREVTAQGCIEGYTDATARGTAGVCRGCSTGRRRRRVYATGMEPVGEASDGRRGGSARRVI